MTDFFKSFYGGEAGLGCSRYNDLSKGLVGKGYKFPSEREQEAQTTRTAPVTPPPQQPEPSPQPQSGELPKDESKGQFSFPGWGNQASKNRGPEWGTQPEEHPGTIRFKGSADEIGGQDFWDNMMRAREQAGMPGRSETPNMASFYNETASPERMTESGMGGFRSQKPSLQQQGRPQPQQMGQEQESQESLPDNPALAAVHKRLIKYMPKHGGPEDGSPDEEKWKHRSVSSFATDVLNEIANKHGEDRDKIATYYKGLLDAKIGKDKADSIWRDHYEPFLSLPWKKENKMGKSFNYESHFAELELQLATIQIMGLTKSLPPGPGKGQTLAQHAKKTGIENAKKTPPKEYAKGGATKKKEYADPKNYKYHIDTPEHVRAAIAYFNKPGNYGMYCPSERSAMYARMTRAAKRLSIAVAEKKAPGNN